MDVRAITFDFWRTLFRDNEGEARRQVRVDALARATGVPLEVAEDAMRVTMREFMRVHIEEQRTLSPADAIPLVERQLDRRLTGVTDELVEAFATAILKHPPLPIEDAFDAVRAAAEYVPVGVISDTGISPSTSLQALLDRHGVLDAFSVLTFSDQVGVSKPQSAIYHQAAAGLHVRANELLHIGDLEPTDVQGALRVGARAVLFAGDNDRFLGATKAHHTYTTWRAFIDDLPHLLNHPD